MLALKDIMTRDVVALSPDLSMREAMELLTSRHISGAPVVSHSRVVGVVSLTDLAEFASATPGVPAEVPAVLDSGEWNVLEEHTVSEAMTPSVVSMPPATPVETAAELMQRAGMHRLFVMDGERLVGVVTTKDVTDAVADQRLTRRVYVFDRRRE